MPRDASMTVTVRVTNKRKVGQTLVVEPWATEYALAPGQALDVAVRGDPQYPLEIDFEDERILLYAFDSAGASVAVFDHGVEAKPSGH